MAKIKIYDGTNWVELQESLAGGTLTANATPILTLKKSASSSGAFLGFKPNNQNVNVWSIGADSSNNFRLSYSTDSGSNFTKKLALESDGSLEVQIIKARTSSSTSSTTYGKGTSGQALMTNGSNVYWGSPSASIPSNVAKKDEDNAFSTQQTINHTGDTPLYLYSTASNGECWLGFRNSNSSASAGNLGWIGTNGTSLFFLDKTGGTAKTVAMLGDGTIHTYARVYEHICFITNAYGYDDGGMSASFRVLSTSIASVGGSVSEIAQLLYSEGYTDGAYASFCPATGTIYDGSGNIYRVIMGVFGKKSGNTYTLGVVYADGNYYPTTASVSNNFVGFVQTKTKRLPLF